MFKIVYCLVSDETDYYYEQLIISLLSLRRHMQDSLVIVMVDNDTYRTLTKNRRKIFELANEVKCIEAPKEYNKKLKSRYLKTRARNNISGDFLFIDTDTIICRKFEPIESSVILSAVPDLHISMASRLLDWGYQENISKMGFVSEYNNIHYNSGVIWVKEAEASYEFYDLWHKLWKDSLTISSNDQPSFNEANYRLNGIVSELDGVWNCQVANIGKAILYLQDAFIIHYFGSNVSNEDYSIYDLCDISLLKDVRNNHYEKVNEIINRPQTAFTKTNIQFVSKDNEAILSSQIYLAILRIYKSLRPLYNGLEKILTLIHKVKFKINNR